MIRPGHPLHGLDLPVWGRLRLARGGHGGTRAARWQQEAHPRGLGSAQATAAGTAAPAAGIIAQAG